MKRKEIGAISGKRIIFILLTVVFALIQNSFLPKTSAAAVYFLIPLIVSIAMFEREFSGFFFGLFAGALWDLAAPAASGVTTLFFALFACACGLLTHYVLRNTLTCAVFLCFTGTLIFSALSLIFNCVSKDFSSIGTLLLNFYLLPALLTVLVTPLFYLSIRSIEKKFRNSIKRISVKQDEKK